MKKTTTKKYKPRNPPIELLDLPRTVARCGRDVREAVRLCVVMAKDHGKKIIFIHYHTYKKIKVALVGNGFDIRHGVTVWGATIVPLEISPGEGTEIFTHQRGKSERHQTI